MVQACLREGVWAPRHRQGKAGVQGRPAGLLAGQGLFVACFACQQVFAAVVLPKFLLACSNVVQSI